MTQSSKTSFGVVGLGKMGAGIARNALSKGYRVLGFDKHPPDDLKHECFIEAQDILGFGTLLRHPRIVFLYISRRPRRRLRA